MIKKLFLFILPTILFVSSCEDIQQYNEGKYGGVIPTFNKPSEDLVDSMATNRSQSQFADVDQVRITINNQTPVTVTLVNGTASYSKSGLTVGTVSIKVDLLGAGTSKYTQTRSVQIIANQNTSASFNAFTITGQNINYTSTTQSTYDGGDLINLSWTNTHAEQPVDIERWDQVGGVWVKTKTIENDFVGTSFSWNTQGESSGESVKIRIQSTISSSFVDSQSFQLISFLVTFDNAIFNDLAILQDGSLVAAGVLMNGSTTTNQDGLLVKIDQNGNIISTASQGTSSTRGFSHIAVVDNEIYALSNQSDGTFNIYKFNSNLTYITSLSTGGTVTGLASYRTNGETYLAISNHYESTTFGINPSVISIRLSDFAFISSWGWHQSSGDEYSFDIDVSSPDGNSILLSKFNTTGDTAYNVNFYGWSSFEPNSGGSNIASNRYNLSSVIADPTTSDLEQMNLSPFWTSSTSVGFQLAALRYSSFSSSGEIDYIGNYNGSWAMDAITINLSSSKFALIVGDFWSDVTNKFVGALYYYDTSDNISSIYVPSALSDRASRFKTAIMWRDNIVAAGYASQHADGSAGISGIIFINQDDRTSNELSNLPVNISSPTTRFTPNTIDIDVPKFDVE